MRLSRQIGISAAAVMIVAPIATAVSPSSAAAARAAAKPHLAAHADFDGDGKADIVVGAPGGNRVQVDYTKAKPHGSHQQWIASPQADTFDFGAALASGDFNGDGFADLAVGAPEFRDSSGDSTGAVYIFNGSKTGLHYSGKAFYGPAVTGSTYTFGTSLSAGDVDADNYADLVVGDPGSPGTSTSMGDVTAIKGSKKGLGKSFVLPSGDPVSDGGFGTSVVLADVNGDGHKDIIVGEPGGGPTLPGGVSTTAGDVQEFLATKTGFGDPKTFLGSTLGAAGNLGDSLAGGDINGDGFADIVAGAPQATVSGQGLAGKVAVLYGAKHGLSGATKSRVLSKATAHVSGNAVSTDRFGLSVAIGDLTADHRGDVIVGVPGGTAGGQPAAGQVYVFRGTKSGVTTIKSEVISQASAGVPGNPVSGAELGSAVTTIGASGAAHRELVIGMPAMHGGGWTLILQGGSHGVTGAHAKTLKDATLGDLFGAALAP
jgi:hypothetical protein